MAFRDVLLGRRVTLNVAGKVVEGRSAFDVRKRFEEQELFSGLVSEVLSSDRNSCTIVEHGDEESPRIKVLASRERLANVNFRGADARDGIEAFSEGPLKVPFEGYAAYAGDGIWYGYLSLRALPEFSQLLAEVTWSSENDHREIRGTYADWEIRFYFPDAESTQPSKVEIQRMNRSPADSGIVVARAIEFLEWESFEGTDVPSRVQTWDLVLTSDRKWETTYQVHTLEEIGPPTEISGRYGDFFIDIPDGTRVQVNDYMGIDFVWENGEIVRKIDRRTLQSLIDQPFFESPVRRLLLMALGAAAIALTGWFIWHRSSQH
ncbi:hypothetical protein Mal4_26710 [Maioricimonas rarisocia]|uniref:Uncharacterized protein n=1 Tax=Maioricimonas rarisocia TaxID=2528026 RepID=A0A517Z7B6_9PLAN|nr:hypothetical protein [Maioricimonas rarisocia]QDU38344.1 hypothetical protein Mal4_26710 [Maioricimonas rarisocia]